MDEDIPPDIVQILKSEEITFEDRIKIYYHFIIFLEQSMNFVEEEDVPALDDAIICLQTVYDTLTTKYDNTMIESAAEDLESVNEETIEEDYETSITETTVPSQTHDVLNISNILLADKEMSVDNRIKMYYNLIVFLKKNMDFVNPEDKSTLDGVIEFLQIIYSRLCDKGKDTAEWENTDFGDPNSAVSFDKRSVKENYESRITEMTALSKNQEYTILDLSKVLTSEEMSLNNRIKMYHDFIIFLEQNMSLIDSENKSTLQDVIEFLQIIYCTLHDRSRDTVEFSNTKFEHRKLDLPPDKKTKDEPCMVLTAEMPGTSEIPEHVVANISKLLMSDKETVLDNRIKNYHHLNNFLEQTKSFIKPENKSTLDDAVTCLQLIHNKLIDILEQEDSTVESVTAELAAGESHIDRPSKIVNNASAKGDHSQSVETEPIPESLKSIAELDEKVIKKTEQHITLNLQKDIPPNDNNTMLSDKEITNLESSKVNPIFTTFDESGIQDAYVPCDKEKTFPSKETLPPDIKRNDSYLETVETKPIKEDSKSIDETSVGDAHALHEMGATFAAKTEKTAPPDVSDTLISDKENDSYLETVGTITQEILSDVSDTLISDEENSSYLKPTETQTQKPVSLDEKGLTDAYQAKPLEKDSKSVTIDGKDVEDTHMPYKMKATVASKIEESIPSDVSDTLISDKEAVQIKFVDEDSKSVTVISERGVEETSFALKLQEDAKYITSFAEQGVKKSSVLYTKRINTKTDITENLPAGLITLLMSDKDMTLNDRVQMYSYIIAFLNRDIDIGKLKHSSTLKNAKSYLQQIYTALITRQQKRDNYLEPAKETENAKSDIPTGKQIIKEPCQPQKSETIVKSEGQYLPSIKKLVMSDEEATVGDRIQAYDDLTNFLKEHMNAIQSCDTTKLNDTIKNLQLIHNKIYQQVTSDESKDQRGDYLNVVASEHTEEDERFIPPLSIQTITQPYTEFQNTETVVKSSIEEIIQLVQFKGDVTLDDRIRLYAYIIAFLNRDLGIDKARHSCTFEKAKYYLQQIHDTLTERKLQKDYGNVMAESVEDVKSDISVDEQSIQEPLIQQKTETIVTPATLDTALPIIKLLMSNEKMTVDRRIQIYDDFIAFLKTLKDSIESCRGQTLNDVIQTLLLIFYKLVIIADEETAHSVTSEISNDNPTVDEQSYEKVISVQGKEEKDECLDVTAKSMKQDEVFITALGKPTVTKPCTVSQKTEVVESQTETLIYYEIIKILKTANDKKITLNDRIQMYSNIIAFLNSQVITDKFQHNTALKKVKLYLQQICSILTKRQQKKGDYFEPAVSEFVEDDAKSGVSADEESITTPQETETIVTSEIEESVLPDVIKLLMSKKELTIDDRIQTYDELIIFLEEHINSVELCHAPKVHGTINTLALIFNILVRNANEETIETVTSEVAVDDSRVSMQSDEKATSIDKKEEKEEHLEVGTTNSIEQDQKLTLPLSKTTITKSYPVSQETEIVAESPIEKTIPYEIIKLLKADAKITLNDRIQMYSNIMAFLNSHVIINKLRFNTTLNNAKSQLQQIHDTLTERKLQKDHGSVIAESVEDVKSDISVDVVQQSIQEPVIQQKTETIVTPATLDTALPIIKLLMTNENMTADRRIQIYDDFIAFLKTLKDSIESSRGQTLNDVIQTLLLIFYKLVIIADEKTAQSVTSEISNDNPTIGEQSYEKVISVQGKEEKDEYLDVTANSTEQDEVFITPLDKPIVTKPCTVSQKTEVVVESKTETFIPYEIIKLLKADKKITLNDRIQMYSNIMAFLNSHVIINKLRFNTTLNNAKSHLQQIHDTLTEQKLQNNEENVIAESVEDIKSELSADEQSIQEPLIQQKTETIVTSEMEETVLPDIIKLLMSNEKITLDRRIQIYDDFTTFLKKLMDSIESCHSQTLNDVIQTLFLIYYKLVIIADEETTQSVTSEISNDDPTVDEQSYEKLTSGKRKEAKDEYLDVISAKSTKQDDTKQSIVSQKTEVVVESQTEKHITYEIIKLLKVDKKITLNDRIQMYSNIIAFLNSHVIINKLRFNITFNNAKSYLQQIRNILTKRQQTQADYLEPEITELIEEDTKSDLEDDGQSNQAVCIQQKTETEILDTDLHNVIKLLTSNEVLTLDDRIQTYDDLITFVEGHAHSVEGCHIPNLYGTVNNLLLIYNKLLTNANEEANESVTSEIAVDDSKISTQVNEEITLAERIQEKKEYLEVGTAASIKENIKLITPLSKKTVSKPYIVPQKLKIIAESQTDKTISHKIIKLLKSDKTITIDDRIQMYSEIITFLNSHMISEKLPHSATLQNAKSYLQKIHNTLTKKKQKLDDYIEPVEKNAKSDVLQPIGAIVTSEILNTSSHHIMKLLMSTEVFTLHDRIQTYDNFITFLEEHINSVELWQRPMLNGTINNLRDIFSKLVMKANEETTEPFTCEIAIDSEVSMKSKEKTTSTERKEEKEEYLEVVTTESIEDSESVMVPLSKKTITKPCTVLQKTQITSAPQTERPIPYGVINMLKSDKKITLNERIQMYSNIIFFLNSRVIINKLRFNTTLNNAKLYLQQIRNILTKRQQKQADYLESEITELVEEDAKSDLQDHEQSNQAASIQQKTETIVTPEILHSASHDIVKLVMSNEKMTLHQRIQTYDKFIAFLKERMVSVESCHEPTLTDSIQSLLLVYYQLVINAEDETAQSVTSELSNDSATVIIQKETSAEEEDEHLDVTAESTKQNEVFITALGKPTVTKSCTVSQKTEEVVEPQTEKYIHYEIIKFLKADKKITLNDRIQMYSNIIAFLNSQVIADKLQHSTALKKVKSYLQQICSTLTKRQQKKGDYFEPAVTEFVEDDAKSGVSADEESITIPQETETIVTSEMEETVLPDVIKLLMSKKELTIDDRIQTYDELINFLEEHINSVELCHAPRLNGTIDTLVFIFNILVRNANEEAIETVTSEVAVDDSRVGMQSNEKVTSAELKEEKEEHLEVGTSESIKQDKKVILPLSKTTITKSYPVSQETEIIAEPPIGKTIPYEFIKLLKTDEKISLNDRIQMYSNIIAFLNRHVIINKLRFNTTLNNTKSYLQQIHDTLTERKLQKDQENVIAESVEDVKSDMSVQEPLIQQDTKTIVTSEMGETVLPDIIKLLMSNEKMTLDRRIQIYDDFTAFLKKLMNSIESCRSQTLNDVIQTLFLIYYKLVIIADEETAQSVTSEISNDDPTVDEQSYEKVISVKAKEEKDEYLDVTTKSTKQDELFITPLDKPIVTKPCTVSQKTEEVVEPQTETLIYYEIIKILKTAIDKKITLNDRIQMYSNIIAFLNSQVIADKLQNSTALKKVKLYLQHIYNTLIERVQRKADYFEPAIAEFVQDDAKSGIPADEQTITIPQETETIATSEIEENVVPDIIKLLMSKEEVTLGDRIQAYEDMITFLEHHVNSVDFYNTPVLDDVIQSLSSIYSKLIMHMNEEAVESVTLETITEDHSTVGTRSDNASTDRNEKIDNYLEPIESAVEVPESNILANKQTIKESYSPHKTEIISKSQVEENVLSDIVHFLMTNKQVEFDDVVTFLKQNESFVSSCYGSIQDETIKCLLIIYNILFANANEDIVKSVISEVYAEESTVSRESCTGMTLDDRNKTCSYIVAFLKRNVAIRNLKRSSTLSSGGPYVQKTDSTLNKEQEKRDDYSKSIFTESVGGDANFITPHGKPVGKLEAEKQVPLDIVKFLMSDKVISLDDKTKIYYNLVTFLVNQQNVIKPEHKYKLAETNYLLSKIYYMYINRKENLTVKSDMLESPTKVRDSAKEKEQFTALRSKQTSKEASKSQKPETGAKSELKENVAPDIVNFLISDKISLEDRVKLYYRLISFLASLQNAVKPEHKYKLTNIVFLISKIYKALNKRRESFTIESATPVASIQLLDSAQEAESTTLIHKTERTVLPDIVDILKSDKPKSLENKIRLYHRLLTFLTGFQNVVKPEHKNKLTNVIFSLSKVYKSLNSRERDFTLESELLPDDAQEETESIISLGKQTDKTYDPHKTKTVAKAEKEEIIVPDIVELLQSNKPIRLEEEIEIYNRLIKFVSNFKNVINPKHEYQLTKSIYALSKVCDFLNKPKVLPTSPLTTSDFALPLEEETSRTPLKVSPKVTETEVIATIPSNIYSALQEDVEMPLDDRLVMYDNLIDFFKESMEVIKPRYKPKLDRTIHYLQIVHSNLTKRQSVTKISKSDKNKSSVSKSMPLLLRRSGIATPVPTQSALHETIKDELPLDQRIKKYNLLLNFLNRSKGAIKMQSRFKLQKIIQQIQKVQNVLMERKRRTPSKYGKAKIDSHIRENVPKTPLSLSMPSLSTKQRNVTVAPMTSFCIEFGDDMPIGTRIKYHGGLIDFLSQKMNIIEPHHKSNLENTICNLLTLNNILTKRAQRDALEGNEKESIWQLSQSTPQVQQNNIKEISTPFSTSAPLVIQKNDANATTSNNQLMPEEEEDTELIFNKRMFIFEKTIEFLKHHAEAVKPSDKSALRSTIRNLEDARSVIIARVENPCLTVKEDNEVPPLLASELTADDRILIYGYFVDFINRLLKILRPKLHPGLGGIMSILSRVRRNIINRKEGRELEPMTTTKAAEQVITEPSKLLSVKGIEKYFQKRGKKALLIKGTKGKVDKPAKQKQIIHEPPESEEQIQSDEEKKSEFDNEEEIRDSYREEGIPEADNKEEKSNVYKIQAESTSYHNKKYIITQTKKKPHKIRNSMRLKPPKIRAPLHRLSEEKAVRLGMLYFTYQYYRKAVKLFDRAIHINSMEAMYFYKRGLAHNFLGHHNRSIRDLKMVIELQPDFEQVYGPLAMQYIRLHKLNEAYPLLNRVLSGNPSEFFTETLKFIEGIFAKKEDESKHAEPHNYYLNVEPRRYDPDVLHAAQVLIRDPSAYNVASAILANRTEAPNPVNKILEYCITHDQTGYSNYTIPLQHTLETYTNEPTQPCVILDPLYEPSLERIALTMRNREQILRKRQLLMDFRLSASKKKSTDYDDEDPSDIEEDSTDTRKAPADSKIGSPISSDGLPGSPVMMMGGRRLIYDDEQLVINDVVVDKSPGLIAIENRIKKLLRKMATEKF